VNVTQNRRRSRQGVKAWGRREVDRDIVVVEEVEVDADVIFEGRVQIIIIFLKLDTYLDF